MKASTLFLIAAVTFFVLCFAHAAKSDYYQDDYNPAIEQNRQSQIDYDRQHAEQQLYEQQQQIQSLERAQREAQQRQDAYTPAQRFTNDFGDCYTCR